MSYFSTMFMNIDLQTGNLGKHPLKIKTVTSKISIYEMDPILIRQDDYPTPDSESTPHVEKSLISWFLGHFIDIAKHDFRKTRGREKHYLYIKTVIKRTFYITQDSLSSIRR